uniref:Odorant receptor n=1 Tax=Ceracris kiangsu TaxID=227354 RepID=A0A6M6DSU9_CERKI|nr:odorant receptor 32 [Ceracris kiangsu]
MESSTKYDEGVSGERGGGRWTLWKDPETASSVLRLNVRCLLLGGLWSKSKGLLYLAYSAFIQLCSVVYIVMCMLSIFSPEGDINDVTLTLMHTFEIVCGILKAVIFFLKRDEYYQIVHNLDRLVSSQRQYLTASKDEHLLMLLDAAHKKTNFLTLVLTGYIYGLVFVWLPFPLILMPSERLMPFVQIPGNYFKEHFSVYIIAYAIQSFVPLALIMVVDGLDCFFVSSVVHAEALLKVLSERIASLGHPHYTDFRLQRFSDMERESRKRNVENNADMTAELRSCIIHHQEIIEFLQRLEKAMNIMVLIQLSFAMFNLCMALYQQTKIPNFTSALKYVIYVPFPTMKIFFYCWAAHNVKEQGEEVSWAAYNCAWPDTNQEFRKSLAITMCRAQRPLLLTAGRIYPINKDAFVSLLKGSYSYYTLLRQFESK